MSEDAGTQLGLPHTMLVPCNRDMPKALQYLVFRYTKFYHRMAGLELAMDLFADPTFQSHFKVCPAIGQKTGNIHVMM